MLQDSQLRIQGSATYLPEDFAEAMRDHIKVLLVTDE